MELSVLSKKRLSFLFVITSSFAFSCHGMETESLVDQDESLERNTLPRIEEPNFQDISQDNLAHDIPPFFENNFGHLQKANTNFTFLHGLSKTCIELLAAIYTYSKEYPIRRTILNEEVTEEGFKNFLWELLNNTPFYMYLQFKNNTTSNQITEIIKVMSMPKRYTRTITFNDLGLSSVCSMPKKITIRDYMAINHQIEKDDLVFCNKKTKIIALKKPFTYEYKNNMVDRLENNLIGADFSTCKNVTIEHIQSLPTIKFLDLMYCGFTTKKVAAITKLSNLQNLISLNLSDNRIGNLAAKHIARSKYLGNLESLNLGNNVITNKGVLFLTSSPQLKKITSINLERNKIDAAGVNLITKCWPTLTHINVAKNALGYAGVKSILKLQNLISLNFDYSAIGDKEITLLANSKNMASLKSLDIAWNKITDIGIRAIADSPYLKNLIHLNVRKIEGDPILSEDALSYLKRKLPKLNIISN
jgi:hypothetical protein